MKEIFIAVPCSDGRNSARLTQHLIYWTHVKDPRVKIYSPLWMQEGIHPLDAARNQAVKDFRETDCDLLWWIDDDVIPPVEAMLRMFNVMEDNPGIDALGAVCFVMKSQDDQYFPYPVTLRYNDEGRYIVHYGEGVDWVDATGGGCVMVRRRVYEKLERPYEFLYHRDGTRRLTCDFHIWQKAQDQGMNLFIDFGLLCDHSKKVSIKGIQDLLAGLKR